MTDARIPAEWKQLPLLEVHLGTGPQLLLTCALLHNEHGSVSLPRGTASLRSWWPAGIISTKSTWAGPILAGRKQKFSFF